MKNHYFIGKLLNPEEAKQLQGSQSYLSRNIKTTGKVINFNTKFAYLGYLDHESLLMLQDKLNNVFESIVNQYGPQKCKYTQFGITGLKTTKKSVSLLYQNDNLQKIIVPFIRHYVKQITEDESDFYPHVALLRFNARDENDILKPGKDGKNILQKTFVPRNPIFTVDSIDLMKGELKVRRMGAPSKYDDMDMVLVNSYKLRGQKTQTQC